MSTETQVLYPGDRIHLAMPCSPTKHGQELAEELERIVAETRDIYLAHGVQVVYTSFNSLLTAPAVVAVFREPT